MLRDATVVVIQRLDLLVVGVMLGLHAVAAYSIGLKLAQMGMKALQPFSALFFPRASGLSAEGDVRGLGALLVSGTRVSLAVANPIMLLLSLLAGPLIVAWVGDGFGDAVAVLVLLALARGAASVAETAWWLLGGAGWIRWTASLSLVEAVVNLGASIALAPKYGPAGVAAGTLIGVVLTRLPVSFLLSPRATGIPPAQFVAGALRPHVLPLLVTAAALLGARSVVVSAPVPVLFTAGLSCVLYWSVYLLTGAPPTEREHARRLLRIWWRRATRRRQEKPG
jgi:O-antigen/teichoic acid export membrane protein